MSEILYISKSNSVTVPPLTIVKIKDKFDNLIVEGCKTIVYERLSDYEPFASTEGDFEQHFKETSVEKLSTRWALTHRTQIHKEIYPKLIQKDIHRFILLYTSRIVRIFNEKYKNEIASDQNLHAFQSEIDILFHNDRVSTSMRDIISKGLIKFTIKANQHDKGIAIIPGNELTKNWFDENTTEGTYMVPEGINIHISSETIENAIDAHIRNEILNGRLPSL